MEHQHNRRFLVLEHQQADLATERERQLTTAWTNQTTGLTNGRAANWAPEAEFSPFRALSLRQMTPNLAAVTSSETFDRFILLSDLQENINNNHHNTNELPSLQQCIT